MCAEATARATAQQQHSNSTATAATTTDLLLCSLSLLSLRTWNVRCFRAPRLPRLADGEKAAQRARARCACVRSQHRDVLSANPGVCERTWRAGCPEGAAVGVCFFGYFLCTSKESDTLLRRRSGSLALEVTRSSVGGVEALLWK